MKKITLIFIATITTVFTLNAQTSGASTFIFTGSNQSFTVPNSITSINIELWGGDGGDGGDGYDTAEGGSGAYVAGSLSVTPGAIIDIIVGEGGTQGTTPTYGGGTAGTYINNGFYGGAGGGRTAIQINGNDVVSAAGGGGAGSVSYTMTNGGVGGSGSGPNGGGMGGSSTSAGEGGFSYLIDPLFTLNINGGANNSGSGVGRNGLAKISWSPILGVPTNSVSNNKIIIFPNPASDFIKISGLTNNENYNIYDLLGKNISKVVVSNNQYINIQNLPKGLYLLKLENGNSIKFIKE